MKVALLNPIPTRRGAVNKDVSGGFGTVSDYGDGAVARVMTRLKRGAIRYPILSFGYIASIFEQAGWEVRYGEDESAAEGADLALVYTSLVAHHSEIALADRLRARKECSVGFVGPFASVRPELFESHGDFVVVGEPESVVERVADGARFTGRVVSAPIEQLDKLPFPSWGAFEPHRFRYRPYFPIGNAFYPVLSSRGCTLSCAYYCPYTAVTGRKWRKRSPGNVIAELRQLVTKYGARRMLFRDPLFTLDRNRALAIADGIRAAGLEIEWVCETHLDYLDEELIDRMCAAGLRSIKVGIESANAESLKQVNRHQPQDERVRRLLAHCYRRGIAVTAFYILGLPGDTIESIDATVDYAISLNTIGAQFTVATPYPGTGFFDEVERRGGLLTDDWEQYDIYTPVMQHDRLTSGEIQHAKSRAYQRYYLRTSWAGKFLGYWWWRARGAQHATAASPLAPVTAVMAANAERRTASARDS